jgi:hypothetical protein
MTIMNPPEATNGVRQEPEYLFLLYAVTYGAMLPLVKEGL